MSNKKYNEIEFTITRSQGLIGLRVKLFYLFVVKRCIGLKKRKRKKKEKSKKKKGEDRLRIGNVFSEQVIFIFKFCFYCCLKSCVMRVTFNNINERN